MEIASEVGINEDSLLADEILLLSKKLENVRSTLTTLNNVTVNDKCKMLIEELAETRNCISSVKKVINPLRPQTRVLSEREFNFHRERLHVKCIV